MQLMIDIDEELYNYMRTEGYDKHLDKRFDDKVRYAVKNGTPLYIGEVHDRNILDLLSAHTLEADALNSMKNKNIEYLVNVSADKESKEPRQTDPVIKGLLKMKNDFGDKGYFIVNNKKYSLGELLAELENQTEVGQKFRDDIHGMILAYLMKFTGEEE